MVFFKGWFGDNWIVFLVMDPAILSGSYIPLFFAAFIFIYLFGYFVVFRHWSTKHRSEASSCFISLFHGTAAASTAAFAIISYNQPALESPFIYFQNLSSLLVDIATINSQSQLGFGCPNTNFQNIILDFSSAYFLVDLLHYIIFFPNDFLFMGHHVATLFVFLTCRYLVLHGAFGVLGLLFLAEITSFCQNVWTLANSQKVNSPVAVKVYDFLSIPFYSLYTLARVFMGPLFFYKMAVYYLGSESGGLSLRWVYLSWIVVILLGIMASILWILNLWIELYHGWVGRIEKKMK